MSIKPILCSVALLTLAGCGASTKTSYTTPALTVPSHWQMQSTTAPEAVTAGPWWYRFGDPQLNTLVEQVLHGNQTLAAAVIDIRRAQQEIDLSHSNALPVFALSGDSGISRNLRSPTYTTRSAAATAAVSYEVDLWGTLASQTDAARWEASATEQDKESLALQLVATTIDLYWQMAYVSEQLEQSELSIQYAQHTVAIAQTKYRLGAISAIDRLAAEQSLAAQLANRAVLLDQQTQIDNAMCLLQGQPPGAEFTVPATRLDQTLPAIAADIPAHVLARRPDLRAAEMRLREDLDQVDAARTSFYPTLTLTGSAGSSSDALLNLVQNPVGGVAATLTAPFVNFWTMKATVGVAQAAYDAAAATFRQTFYQALQDVENALAARTHYAMQEQQLVLMVGIAQESERRYAYDYQAGAVPLQTLLDAQQNLRSAQTNLAALHYAQWLNQVQLYQALGGSDRET